MKYEYYSPTRILNVHKHSDSWFWDKYSAHPYLGCQHGCEYCYNREKKYSPYHSPETYSELIRIKENAAELLRKELSKVPRDVIIVGDYQPIEAETKLSRKMLQVCLDLEFPALILEKSDLVLRDLDIIRAINKKSWACVIFSIITTKGDDLRSLFEPRAPPVSRRFKAMRKISNEGVLSGGAFMPILPFLYDDEENLEAVVRATAENGGKFVLAGSLTLASPQKEWYYDVLSTRFPELVLRYEALYEGKYGPSRDYVGNIGKRVEDLCRVHGITDRMPRYIPPGELGMNKRIAEILHNWAYRFELDCASLYKVWAYRKAAWSIDELETGVSSIYSEEGRRGLESISGVGRKLSGVIEEELRKESQKT